MTRDDPYASHIHVLAALAKNLPIRTVLEFGGGWHSTSLFLNRAAFPDLTDLVTVETDERWASEVRSGDSRHAVQLVERAADAVPARLHYDLVLVDDSDTPNRRVETLRAVSAARPAGLTVIHDFEQDDYQEATRFDHVAVSSRLTPWTAVAWNEGSRHGCGRLYRVVSDA